MSKPAATAKGAQKPSVFSPAFYAFLVSQVISWLGNQVDGLAIPWLVQELTGSPAALGAVAVAMDVPDILATPFMGALVDRVDRRRLMVFIDACSGLVVLLIAFLVWRDSIEMWHLYASLALLAVIRSAYGPAEMALTPTLVDRAGLTRANALTTGLSQGTGVMGPAVAAGLMAMGGLSGAIAADGISFLVAALLLVSLRIRPNHNMAKADEGPGANATESANSAPEGNSIFAGVAEGARYIVKRPVIRTLLVSFALINFGLAPLMVLMPVFVKALQAGAGGLALLTTCMAVGGLAGAFIVGVLPEMQRKGVLVAVSPFAASTVYLILAWAPTLLWAAFLMTLSGLFFPWIQVNVNVVFQRLVPSEMQGRVFSVRFFVARCLSPLGAGLAGILAEQIGVRPVMAVGAVIGMLAAALTLLVKPLRMLRV